MTYPTSDMAIGFILGGIVGVTAQHWVRKATTRRSPKPNQSTIAYDSALGMTIGHTSIPIVTVARGSWANDNIICHNLTNPVALDDAVRERIDQIADEVKAAQQAGRPAPFNGHMYGLRAFDISTHVFSDGPMLNLTFSPTDYFTMLATDCQLDVPLTIEGTQTTLRRRYQTNTLRESPIPRTASAFGVTIQFVTSDRQTAFVRRGPTATDPNAMFCSMGESSSQFDLIDGVLSPVHIAVRGVEEEYGISIRPDQVEWTAFLATTSHGQYHLSGIVRLPITGDELLAMHTAGIGEDHWEIGTLYLCPFDPQSVAHFLEQTPRWIPLGLATVYHALFADFGWERVQEAFPTTLVVDALEHLPSSEVVANA